MKILQLSIQGHSLEIVKKKLIKIFYSRKINLQTKIEGDCEDII